MLAASPCGLRRRPRQDADEPSGTFRGRRRDAPASRARSAWRSPCRIVVAVEQHRHARRIPNVAVTVDGFATRSERAGPGRPARPVWIVDDGPRPATTAYIDTWALGRLEPGDGKRFMWRVTAVQPGTHTVSYQVAAGLDGKADGGARRQPQPRGLVHGRHLRRAPVARRSIRARARSCATAMSSTARLARRSRRRPTVCFTGTTRPRPGGVRPLRERFDAGSAVVAVGADPAAREPVHRLVRARRRRLGGLRDARPRCSRPSRSTRSLAVAPRFGAGGRGAQCRSIAVAALAIVAVQLLDPPPVGARRGHRRPAAGSRSPATAAHGRLGALLTAASISVTVDVRGRERRRRAAAIDAREGAAYAAETPTAPDPADADAVRPTRSRAARCAALRAASEPPTTRPASGSRPYPGARSRRSRSADWTMSAVVCGLIFEVLRFAARRPSAPRSCLLEVEGRFRADAPAPARACPRLVAERARPRRSRSRRRPPTRRSPSPTAPPWRATLRGGGRAARRTASSRSPSAASCCSSLHRRSATSATAPADRERTAGARGQRAAPSPPTRRATAAGGGAGASPGTEREAREQRRRRGGRACARLATTTPVAPRRWTTELAAVAPRSCRPSSSASARSASAALAERADAVAAERGATRRALRPRGRASPTRAAPCATPRADVESMQRDVERERERADAAEAAVPRGRVTELDGEPSTASRSADAADDAHRAWPSSRRPRRRPRPPSPAPTDATDVATPRSEPSCPSSRSRRPRRARRPCDPDRRPVPARGRSASSAPAGDAAAATRRPAEAAARHRGHRRPPHRAGRRRGAGALDPGSPARSPWRARSRSVASSRCSSC